MYQVQTNGLVNDITDKLQIGRPWIDASSNVQLTRQYGIRLEAVFFGTGIFLQVDMRSSWVNFRVYVPHRYKDRTQGFLGNLDGNATNEFHTKENTSPRPDISSYREICEHLEEHCEYIKLF